MCVTGIFGARLFYIIEYWDEYQKPTVSATVLAIINYTKGGLVVYGALAGAGAATIVFLWRNKLPVLKLCDIIAPSLLVGLALGRVGCFLNGCCYGGQCDLPWAVTFPGNTGSESNPASPPYLKQASTGKLILHGIHFDPDAAAPAIVRSIDNGSPVLPSGLQPGDELAAISVELPGAKRPLEYSAEESPYSRRPVLTVAAVEEVLARIESPGTKATFRVFDAAGRPATAQLEFNRACAGARAELAGASHAAIQCHRRLAVCAIFVGLVSAAATRGRSDGAVDLDLPDHANFRRKHPHRRTADRPHGDDDFAKRERAAAGRRRDAVDFHPPRPTAEIRFLPRQGA